MDGSPPRLAQLQQSLQAALLRVDPDAGTPVARQLQAHIAPGARLGPAQLLAIYRNGYYARLLQCMQGQFKSLSHALGPALFADFARQYLADKPSRSATLALLGQDFPGWLQLNRPDAGSQDKEDWIDFLVDLADFEWTLSTLFDAPGSEAEGYAEADELLNPRLRLQPCLRLCHYRYPVSEYHRQVAAGLDPSPPLVQPSWLALVRTRYNIGIFTVLPAQHHLLTQLQLGAPVADALHGTAQAFGRSPEVVERGWERWRDAWAAAGFFQRG